jgi:Holliday junction resolvase RusA-like endonuclease
MTRLNFALVLGALKRYLAILERFIMKILEIDPVGKPRMSRRDRKIWSMSPAAARYWCYADKLRLICPRIEWDGLSLTFGIKMPRSWTNKKKLAQEGEPHRSAPDLSNLIKAFEDALLKNDSGVWYYERMRKVWMNKGCIIIHSPCK